MQLTEYKQSEVSAYGFHNVQVEIGKETVEPAPERNGSLNCFEYVSKN